jgi:hypothetical protein
MNNSETSFYVHVGCLISLIVPIVRAVINFILIFFLWNWLMPDLFGLSKISFFQTVGIFFLLGLFRSFLSFGNSSDD